MQVGPTPGKQIDGLLRLTLRWMHSTVSGRSPGNRMLSSFQIQAARLL